MTKTKTEAEASDVAAPSAETQPPASQQVGSEGATPPVAADVSLPAAATAGDSVEGGKAPADFESKVDTPGIELPEPQILVGEVSIGIDIPEVGASVDIPSANVAVEGAKEPSVGGATPGATAPAAPGETDSGGKTTVMVPKEESSAPVQTDSAKPPESAGAPVPAAPVAEGSAEGGGKTAVDPKGEVDAAEGKKEEEQGDMSDARLAEMKKSKGRFGNIFKNSCLQAEVKVPDETGEVDPNATSEPDTTGQPEAVGDAAAPKATEDALPSAPPGDEQAPTSEMRSVESKKWKRGILWFKRSDSSIPAGAVDTEPGAPTPEPSGDVDGKATGAPSEGVAPAVPTDAPQQPSAGGEASAPSVADATKSSSAPDEAGKEKAEEVQASARTVPSDVTMKGRFFGLLKKPSMPDSGAAGDDVAVAVTGTEAPGDVDTKGQTASAEAGALSTTDPEAEPGDAPADSKPEGVQAGETETPSAEAKSKTKSRRFLFRKPSTAESNAADTKAGVPAPEAPGDVSAEAPEAPAPAPDAEIEKEKSAAKAEDGKEGGPDPASAEKPKRTLLQFLTRKSSMPDSGATDAEVGAPASEAPADTDVKPPASVEGAAPSTDQPTAPAPKSGEKPEGDGAAAESDGQASAAADAPVVETKKTRKWFSRRSLSNVENTVASGSGQTGAPSADDVPSAPADPSTSADGPVQPEVGSSAEIGAGDAPGDAQATAPESLSPAKKSRSRFNILFSRKPSMPDAEPSTDAGVSAPEGSGAVEATAKLGDAPQPSGEASAPSASADVAAPPAPSGTEPGVSADPEADAGAPAGDPKADAPAPSPDAPSTDVKKTPRNRFRFPRWTSSKTVEAPTVEVEASVSEAPAGAGLAAQAMPTEPNVQPSIPADMAAKPTPASTGVTVP